MNLKRIKDSSYGVIPYRRGRTGAHGKEFEFFLVKNNKSTHGGGHWAFPKGHKEARETDLEAALRELREETGIKKCKVQARKKFIEKYIFKSKSARVFKTVTYFPALVFPQKIKLQKSEVSSYAWLGFKKAIKKITFLESQNLLKRAHDYLSKN